MLAKVLRKILVTTNPGLDTHTCTDLHYEEDAECSDGNQDG